MCDSYMKKDATVTFNKRDQNAKMKELEIKEAYMVGFNESFDSTGSGAMIQSLTLSAKGLKLGNAEHDNEWPV
jgi:small ligand-binding sensory domain FIST